MTARAALACLALALGTTVSLAAPPEFAALGVVPYDPPKPAPTFALPNLDGQTVGLAELRGKVVLLYFWTTW